MRSSYSGSVIGPKMSTCTLPRMFMPAPWITRTLGIALSVRTGMAGILPARASRQRAEHQVGSGDQALSSTPPCARGILLRAPWLLRLRRVWRDCPHARRGEPTFEEVDRYRPDLHRNVSRR